MGDVKDLVGSDGQPLTIKIIPPNDWRFDRQLAIVSLIVAGTLGISGCYLRKAGRVVAWSVGGAAAVAGICGMGTSARGRRLAGIPVVIDAEGIRLPDEQNKKILFHEIKTCSLVEDGEYPVDSPMLMVDVRDGRRVCVLKGAGLPRLSPETQYDVDRMRAGAFTGEKLLSLLNHRIASSGEVRKGGF